MNAKLKKSLKRHLPPWLISELLWVYSWKSIFSYPKFFGQFFKFSSNAKATRPELPVKFWDLYPRLGEATATTGFDHHYIYHPAWAARILAKTKPSYHVDISSTLYFSTLVSAFIPVRFYDYRPAQLELDNLTSGHADLVALPFADNEIQSLSCMHTVEHVGLGRYGDPMDVNGDLKAIKELERVLSKGGNLLFVVPIGQSKIIFNAHRIYAYDQIIKYFSGLKLKEFSLITDSGFEKDFIVNATKEQSDQQLYGCGCFWFVKE